MRAADPAAKLRELALAPAREGLRADPRGGRRRRRRGGRRPLRLHPRAGEPARAPTTCCLFRIRCSRSPSSSASRRRRDADLVQLYEREHGQVRGRDAVLLRDGEQVATVVDLPWEEDGSRRISSARAVDGRALVLAGGLGPDNVRAAIDAVRPWAVDASSSLESRAGRQGSRRACGRSWRAAHA